MGDAPGCVRKRQKATGSARKRQEASSQGLTFRAVLLGRRGLLWEMRSQVRQFCKKWGRVLMVAGLAVVLPGLGVLALYGPMEGVVDGLRRSGGGVWWPVWLGVWVGVGGLLVGVAVLPTHAVSLASGFVFGGVWGTAGAWAAVVIGSALGWSLARVAAGPGVREAVERTRAGRVLVGAMVETQGWRSAGAVTLARLPPQVPFALGTVVAASVGVRLSALVAGTAAGMLPRVAVVAWFGAGLAELGRGGDGRVLAVSVIGGVVGLTGLGVWAWRALRRREKTTAIP